MRRCRRAAPDGACRAAACLIISTSHLALGRWTASLERAERQPLDQVFAQERQEHEHRQQRRAAVAAASGAISTPGMRLERSPARPAGSGSSGPDRISANRNSFQLRMKPSSPAARMPGAATGTAIQAEGLPARGAVDPRRLLQLRAPRPRRSATSIQARNGRLNVEMRDDQADVRLCSSPARQEQREQRQHQDDRRQHLAGQHAEARAASRRCRSARRHRPCAVASGSAIAVEPSATIEAVGEPGRERVAGEDLDVVRRGRACRSRAGSCRR